MRMIVNTEKIKETIEHFSTKTTYGFDLILPKSLKNKEVANSITLKILKIMEKN